MRSTRFAAQTFKWRITQRLIGEETESVLGNESANGEAVVDLAALLRLPDDDAFLREAYRRVLKREPDIVGFLHHRSLLKNHVPRSVILRSLARSAEAQRTGLRYTGVPGLGSVATSLPSRLRGQAADLLAKVAHRARRAYRAVLLAPLASVEAKVDCLLTELQARHEQLSAKVDSYVAHLSATQEAVRSQLDEIMRWQLAMESQQGCVEESLRASLTEEFRKLAESVAGQIERDRAALHQSLADLRSVGEQLVSRLGLALSKEVRGLGQSLAGQLDHRTATLHESIAELSAASKEAASGLRSLLSAVEANILASHRSLSARAGSIEERLSHLAARWAELSGKLASRQRSPLVALSPEVLLTEVDGFMLLLPASEWRLAAYLALRGPLEPGVTRLFKCMVKPGMVVADVGAHFGWYTLQAARLLAGRGKVYSFEPTPESFRLLRQNVQLNGFLESDVVELRSVAVNDACGEATLALNPDDSTQNTLFADPACTQSITVKTMSLDQALGGESHVDVVKIDVEGAELWVLRGMQGILQSNPHIRILMEFAPVHLRRAGIEPDAFWEELTGTDLKVTRIDDLTGDLLDVTRQELGGLRSAMLLLTRTSWPGEMLR